MTTPTGLVFDNDSTIQETLTGSSYVIDEFYNRDQGPNSPQVTLNFTAHNVSLSGELAGGWADNSWAYPADQTLNFNNLTLDNYYIWDANLTLKGHTLDATGNIMTHANVAIDANVVGTGEWNLWFDSATLNGKVGSGQTFSISTSGSVTVNDRHHFDGNINIQPGVVDFSVLVAKVDATAFDFNGSTLALYSGQNVVHRLAFTDPDTFGVYQVGHSVVISNTTPAGGVALPLHSAGA
jgi:hypothetical protein